MYYIDILRHKDNLPSSFVEVFKMYSHTYIMKLHYKIF